MGNLDLKEECKSISTSLESNTGNNKDCGSSSSVSSSLATLDKNAKMIRRSIGSCVSIIELEQPEKIPPLPITDTIIPVLKMNEMAFNSKLDEKFTKGKLISLINGNIFAPEMNLNKSHNTESDENIKINNQKSGWKRYLGILLALFSSMIFPLAGLIVKSLPQYHPFSVTFWRFQGILLPAIPMALYHRCFKKEQIFETVLPLNAPGRWKTLAILCVRGFAGASSVVCMFYSLQFISVADTTVISFSTPVFVTLAAHLCLGEKCGVIPIISGLCALAGVFVIARPPILTGEQQFDQNNLIGVAFAIGCMLLATATFVVLRYLRELHYSIMNLFFGFWGTAESLILSLIVMTFELPQGVEHWLLALALAAITFFGQTCKTLSLKFEQAGTISLVRSCDVIFAFVWQFIILGVIPDCFSLIGGSIVIFGILLTALRKWVSELSPDDSIRLKCSWILK